MKTHYTEADLLETWYTQPGESMPVMMHLADCEACAERYERLSRKLRSLAACDHERPETFWSRQRIAIARKIAGRQEPRVSFARVTRFAAAALIVLSIAGLMTWKIEQSTQVPATASGTVAVSTAARTEPAASQTAQISMSSDPWQSEALSDYSSIVAWESWVETTPGSGDQSL